MTTSPSYGVAATFYQANFGIRFDLPQAEVRELLRDPHAASAARRATLDHELHHFYNSIGTSFGLFVLSTLRGQSSVGMRLARNVLDATGSVHKPLLPWLARGHDTAIQDPEQSTYIRALGEEWQRVERFLVGVSAGTPLTLADALGSLVTTGYTAATLSAAGPSLQHLTSDEINRASNDQLEKWRGSAVDRAQLSRVVEDMSDTLLHLRSTTPPDAWSMSINPGPPGEPLDWMSLLEGSAKLAEFGSLVLEPGPTPPLRLQEIYSRAPGTMTAVFRRAGTSVRSFLEFLFLFDLAVNPSIDPAHRLPARQFAPRGLTDFFPGWRFLQACEAAAALELDPFDGTVERLDERYRAYGERVCTALGWEAPWTAAERALSEGAPVFKATREHLFLKACKLRIEHPAVFATFPCHPSSHLLVEAFGLPRVAAADSSFWMHVPSLRKGREFVLADLDALLGMAHYVDQLMLQPGEFDPSDDPGAVQDAFATVQQEARNAVWQRYLLDPSDIVFD